MADRPVLVDETVGPPGCFTKSTGLAAAVLPDGTWTLFDAQSDQVRVLSATAGILWEFCDGTHDAGALIREINDLYPAESEERIRRDVHETLARFVAEGLVLPAAIPGGSEGGRE